MDLLAGVGNGLFFLPVAGERVAISIKYTLSLLDWVYRAQLRLARQTNEAGWDIQRLNQCTQ